MDLAFNWIILILFLASFFTSNFIKRRKRSNELNGIKKLPPGPRKLPFIGNIHHLVGSLPHHALRSLAQKHGDLMHLQLGEVSAVVASTPQVAKAIMKTHDLAFANRPEILVAKIICYDYSDIAYSPYGDYWRQIRKICTFELLSNKIVRSLGSIRQDEVLRVVSSIQGLAGSGKPVNLTQQVSSYTSSMVCRSAFGGAFEQHRNALLELMNELKLRASGFDVSDLFPSRKYLHYLSWMKPNLLEMRNRFDEILDTIIREHVENQARTRTGNGKLGQEDLIDVLLRINQTGDLHFPITNSNIKAILVDVFSGGTESSATVVEWSMAEMIRNPQVLAKAQNEIREAFMGKKTIEETDIQELSYLKLVIKETLRLHPPFPLLLPRSCREECEINGYTIPVNTRVVINAWAMGRDPRYWDEPQSFRPERFVDNNFVEFNGGTNFEYVPFGGGRRICPGISFGLANIEVPLAYLLYYFNWKLPDDIHSTTDLDMTEAFGITAPRKNNLFLVASMHEFSQSH